MDEIQNDHLKAYGIAYFSISKGHNVEWLLNYRGGSFLIDNFQNIKSECKIRGVSFENVTPSTLLNIYSIIEENNMDIVLLEKKPKIAGKEPVKLNIENRGGNIRKLKGNGATNLIPQYILLLAEHRRREDFWMSSVLSPSLHLIFLVWHQSHPRCVVFDA